MPDSKKKNGTGKFLTILVILLVIGGAFYAYKAGLIPGFESKEKQVTQNLKQEIAAFKGDNARSKLLGYFEDIVNNDALLTPEQKQEASADFQDAAKKVAVNFAFQKLVELEQSGKGAVKIIAPVLEIDSPDDGVSGKVKLGSIEIAKDIMNPNHYFYKESGDIEVYSNANGAEQKVLAINYKTDGNEIKFNDKSEVVYSKGSARDVEVLEGRSNMVLARIGAAYSEQTYNENGDDVEIAYKSGFKNIEAGDLLKMMIGAIEPISFEADLDYEGDNPKQVLMNMQAAANAERDRIERALKGEKVGASDGLNLKGFEGDAAIKNISILMGDAGFKFNGDLNFAGTGTPLPKGEATLVFANYEKFFATLNKFFPTPEQEVADAITLMKKIGEEQSDDMIFKLNFDGTENVKIGGKTFEEIEQIQAELVAKKAPKFVPDYDYLDKKQTPVTTPKVETKELN